MRKYYVHYWRDFGNTYNLYYAETTEQEALAREMGAEQITRKRAEQLCRDENYRRKYDTAFSTYADNVIYPIDFDGHWMDCEQVLTKKGYTMEYRNSKIAARAAYIAANPAKC